jgi:hypothetical protein
MKTETGYAGIYCHSDGYETGVGAILNEHYQDSDKVKSLIALGDLSMLGKNLEPRSEYSHKFGDRFSRDVVRRISVRNQHWEVTKAHVDYDATMSYHRDRGDKLHITKGRTIQSVVNKIDCQYIYVFENGDWTCNGVPLVKAIKAAQAAGGM